MSHVAEPNSTVPQSTDVPSNTPAAAASVAHRHILPTVALLCACITIWIVQHSYYGLVHDSEMYLIQGLARLNPDLFAADIYFRYGSQDRFTVFGPVFAQAMQLLGIEN